MSWRECDYKQSYRRTDALIADDELVILHLSDPHFSGKWRFGLRRRIGNMMGLGAHDEIAWRAIPVALNQSGHTPNILVITGDVSAVGSSCAFRYARNQIENLASDIGLPRERIIVVPGNHDRFVYYMTMAVGLFGRSFERYFSDYAKPRRITLTGDGIGRHATVYPFDSSYSGFRLFPIYSSRGRIERDAFTRFASFRSGQGSDTDRDITVCLLHHHPLPVPSRNTSAYTIMKNGGTFMSYMHRHEVDVVLHGHEHQSYSCRICYDEGNHDTVISAAGTCAYAKESQKAFSVVRVNKNKRIIIEHFVYDNAEFKYDKNLSRSFRLHRCGMHGM